jgi:hypothetical protein
LSGDKFSPVKKEKILSHFCVFGSNFVFFKTIEFWNPPYFFLKECSNQQGGECALLGNHRGTAKPIGRNRVHSQKFGRLKTPKRSADGEGMRFWANFCPKFDRKKIIKIIN